MNNLPRGFISDVPSDHYFWLHDGRAIKNLKELADNLKNMDNGLFMFHVNTEKNDFANWILHIIDTKLGEELLGITDKDTLISTLESELETPISKVEPTDLNFPLLKKLEIEEEKVQVPEISTNVKSQLKVILEKEKEIESREKIIQNLEERIEKKLQGERQHTFFSKEFIEGILIGILILLICGLVYLKFFMPY